MALWPSVNLKLRPRLLKELKPGTRVVSLYHDMVDWAPDETRRVGGIDVYLWEIRSNTLPAPKVSGKEPLPWHRFPGRR